jgi:hypothetical protein
VSRCRSLSALVLVAAVSTVLSGCRTEYIIDRGSMAEAEELLVHTGRMPAVPAERARDGRQVYVRYSALDLQRARPISPTHVVASAPDKRGHRIAGPILLGFGLTALVAGIGLTIADVSTPCTDAYDGCLRGLLSLAIGLPLGLSGTGLTIAGGVLTHRGYHDDIERRADRVFLDVDPKLAARR